MKKQYKNEIRYISDLIDSVHYPPNAFTIIQNDGKYIFGITSAPSHELPIAKILEYTGRTCLHSRSGNPVSFRLCAANASTTDSL